MALQIPNEVLDYVQRIFAQANRTVSRQLDTVPNTYETVLDQTLITALASGAVPVAVAPGWTVRLETHFLGGGRHFGSWEIADIGLLVTYRQYGLLLRTKLALLQAKRLYPIEEAIEDYSARDYRRGFGRLFESHAAAAAASQPRNFTFLPESTYSQLMKGQDQYARIAQYESQLGIEVHYLLYNPSQIPLTVKVPLQGPSVTRAHRVGVRVVNSAAIRKVLDKAPDGASPRYRDLVDRLPRPYGPKRNVAGHRLEVFVRRLIRCRGGVHRRGSG
jgi:hypothetical protein